MRPSKVPQEYSVVQMYSSTKLITPEGAIGTHAKGNKQTEIPPLNPTSLHSLSRESQKSVSFHGKRDTLCFGRNKNVELRTAYAPRRAADSVSVRRAMEGNSPEFHTHPDEFCAIVPEMRQGRVSPRGPIE